MSKMKPTIYLIGLSILPLLIAAQAATVSSLQPSVEILSGNQRIFSGETLKLTCSLPVTFNFTWRFLWFRGSENLAQTGHSLTLWDIHVKKSGKYSCQGQRDSSLGPIFTQQSLPVEINVDGGWAILHTAPNPVLVGESLNFICYVRNNPPIHETILYKNGAEVMRLNGSDPLTVTNVTHADEGMYSCRASWDIRRQTLSVVSVEAPVRVLEVLTQPLLEIDVHSELSGKKKAKLICYVQYNARPPAPQINYYFYKEDDRLSVAKSENYDLVEWKSGQYSCRVRVPQLGLSRWSEPRTLV